jgi:putative DNA primase/helicase
LVLIMNNLALQTTGDLDELERALAVLPEGMGQSTPQGCAIRFARFAGAGLRYVAEDRAWAAFDGCRWDSARGEVIAEKLYEKWIGDELRLVALAPTKSSIESAARLASAKAKREVLALAQPKLAVSREAFDRDADDLLVTPTGTVDLRTGALTPNDPAQLLTQCTSVGYDPAAAWQCPNFMNLVSKLAGDEPTTMAWLWRAIGYTLTGRTHEDVFFYLRGPGSNGKSTLVKTLAELLGDYAHKLPIAVITVGSEHHATELAALRGRRLVMSSEVERGQRLRESLVKDLTGGDTMAAREIHQQARAAAVWAPKLKLWLTGNHDLRIAGTDEGIWRRVRKVMSSHTFPRTGVRDALACNEGAAILASAVTAAGQWYQHGLGADPASVRAATADYRKEQDHLGQFFDDCLAFSPGAFIPAAALTSAYRAWCVEHGYDHPAGPKELAERLRSRGCEPKQQGGPARTRGWSGVTIAPSGLS